MENNYGYINYFIKNKVEENYEKEKYNINFFIFNNYNY